MNRTLYAPSSAAAPRMPRQAPGFSLIELLVVIAIIGLIVSIVIPGVSSARKSARKADTLNLCQGISQACSQFILDQRRAPGYFSMREMGNSENLVRGFSQFDNAMLDLAGGILPGTAAAQPGDLNDVGPVAGRGVKVRPSLIGTTGANGKGYFIPKAKYFKSPAGDDPDVGDRWANATHKKLPVLVDTQGTPLLMWTTDDSAKRDITVEADLDRYFGREVYNGAIPDPALLYWAQNSAFLGGNGSDDDLLIGRQRVRMSSESLLGKSVTAHVGTMSALLANPNTPRPPRVTGDPFLPTAARSSVMIHAAGPNAIYFGLSEAGAKRNVNLGVVKYSDNFGVNPQDVLVNFDDILISAN